MPAQQNTNAQEELQNNLRRAVLEKDVSQVEFLLEGETLEENFRFELIGGLIAAGDHATLVSRLLDQAGEDVTPTAFVSLLASAARQAQLQTAALLHEKCVTAGLKINECDEVIVKNAAADNVVSLAAAVTAGDEKSAQRTANMMLTATVQNQHETLRAFLAAGTSPAGHGSVILLMLLEDRPTHFPDEEQKRDYLSLTGGVIQACADHHEMKALDLLLNLVAYRVPDGKEYPELLETLVEAGADPFTMKEEAKRYLVSKYEESDDTDRAAKWRNWFDAKGADYTAQQAQTFDTIFGADFRFNDLKQTASADGASGLQLAARARRIPDVMKSLQAGGDLTVEDIFAENPRGESMISLAIDRGDAAALLSPTYWGGRGVDMVSVLEQRLSDDRKKWIDMDSLSVKVDLHELHKITQGFMAQYRMPARPRRV